MFETLSLRAIPVHSLTVDPNCANLYNIHMPSILMQSQVAGLTAAAVFYLTLLIIFLAAIITALATKWTRDKCLKLLQGYRVTIERGRGQTLWGRLKVFSSGVEVIYDHPYVNPHGRQKTSYLFYQAELDQQILSIVRHHEHLSEQQKSQRLRQIEKTFNPGFFRRTWRGVRNLANTLRDAINASIGAAVTQFQRTNPAAAVLTSQSGAVNSISQTIVGRFANAYEPLLEQYIGQPVILQVVDPINPNNLLQEYPGYLADYTQQFIAVFNVEHATAEPITITLPDVASGEPLPPLPAPPPPNAPPPPLPPPLMKEHGVAVRIDGLRMKVQNTHHEVLAVNRLEREGFEPLALSVLLPPNATLNLPACDARGARLVCQVLRAVDVVAPRKYATVRHAGILLERRGLVDDLQLDRLPLVSKLLGESEEAEEVQQKSS